MPRRSAGPFGTALGVQAAFAAAGPFVAALAVIGLGRLDRDELSHPLDVPGDRRPCATGCPTADAPAAA